MYYRFSSSVEGACGQSVRLGCGCGPSLGGSRGRLCPRLQSRAARMMNMPSLTEGSSVLEMGSRMHTRPGRWRLPARMMVLFLGPGKGSPRIQCKKSFGEVKRELMRQHGELSMPSERLSHSGIYKINCQHPTARPKDSSPPRGLESQGSLAVCVFSPDDHGSEC